MCVCVCDVCVCVCVCVCVFVCVCRLFAELRSYVEPPPVIKSVLLALLYILYPDKDFDSWTLIKKVLGHKEMLCVKNVLCVNIILPVHGD